MEKFFSLQFDGGMTPDIRRSLKNQNIFAYMENFDNRSDMNRLAPNYSIVKDGGNYANSYNLSAFAYDNYDSAIWGLGATQLMYLATPFSTSQTWSASVFPGNFSNANTEAGVLTVGNDVYWIYNNNKVAKFHNTGGGTGSFTLTFATFPNAASGQNTAQAITAPLTMGKDANIYFGIIDNSGTPQLMKLTTAGSLQAMGLVPIQYTLSSLCQYANYLTLGCYSNDINKNSVSFLWDYSSVDITDQIDCGVGKVKGVANLEGGILVVSESVDLPTATSFASKSLIFQHYTGSIRPLVTIKGQDSIGAIFQTSSQTYNLNIRVQNNIAYFPCQFTFDTGSNHAYKYGIVKFGRRDSSSPLSFTVDAINGNETGEIWGCLYVGKYVIYSSYTDSTHTSVFTSLPTAYSTAKIETITYNGGDISVSKKLIAFATYCEPLLAGQSISVYYRIQGQTAWTTMYVHSNIGECSHIARINEPDGSNFPDLNEITFRIVSAGGAVLLGYKGKAEVTTDVYGG